MPTSASCPPPTEPRIARMRGFSLLEMLVVLVILGMAAALVAPSLSRTAERVRESGEREDVRRALSRLPILAREQGRSLEFVGGAPIELPGRLWPEGWGIVAASSIRIEASGWCGGGEVQVSGPAGPRRWRLVSPDCRVEDVDAP